VEKLEEAISEGGVVHWGQCSSARYGWSPSHDSVTTRLLNGRRPLRRWRHQRGFNGLRRSRLHSIVRTAFPPCIITLHLP
jgi:hypothetical protein